MPPTLGAHLWRFTEILSPLARAAVGNAGQRLWPFVSACKNESARYSTHSIGIAERVIRVRRAKHLVLQGGSRETTAVGR